MVRYKATPCSDEPIYMSHALYNTMYANRQRKKKHPRNILWLFEQSYHQCMLGECFGNGLQSKSIRYAQLDGLTHFGQSGALLYLRSTFHVFVSRCRLPITSFSVLVCVFFFFFLFHASSFAVQFYLENWFVQWGVAA